MSQGILLCVDDERIVLNALKDQLHHAFGGEHLIELAESAEEGLEILDELVGNGYVPLVIISDWLMPHMNGDAFLLAAHKRFPFVIKIILSGHISEAALQRVRDGGALHEFIAKPWDPDDLVRCVRAGIAEFERAPRPD